MRDNSDKEGVVNENLYQDAQSDESHTLQGPPLR